MLHETIRKQRFIAQHSVATLLRHCFEWLQHCSSIATLCCAKNCRCESSRVTSPLENRTANFGLPKRQTSSEHRFNVEVSSWSNVYIKSLLTLLTVVSVQEFGKEQYRLS